MSPITLTGKGDSPKTGPKTKVIKYKGEGGRIKA